MDIPNFLDVERLNPPYPDNGPVDFFYFFLILFFRRHFILNPSELVDHDPKLMKLIKKSR